jgi:hypothetical protein
MHSQCKKSDACQSFGTRQDIEAFIICSPEKKENPKLAICGMTV